MNASLNHSQPLIMHIDLNSCFAIVEQQANPLIRNKPVAVAAYDTPGGMVLAASYEAKHRGVNIIMSVREARLLCPDIIVMMPDPAKYRNAHKRFRRVLLNYTNEVTPKSIDEFVIDLAGSPAVREGRSPPDIAREIKQRLKETVGEYITVNIGIAANRFLAKVAAELNKPDGLDTITAESLKSTLKKLKLTDLPGINIRYQARLNLAGIYTPLDFLSAGADYLKKVVFQSKVGWDWYLRLRGWEVDDVVWGRKSFGHQYALGDKTTDRQKLSQFLMKLCEKTGRRLRRHDFSASGVQLWLSFEGRQYWHKGTRTSSEMYATSDIYRQAQKLLTLAPIPAKVTQISVSVYNLRAASSEQLELFGGSRLDKRALAQAADKVNDKFGEFTLVPAIMSNMNGKILDRIAFGNVKDIY